MKGTQKKKWNGYYSGKKQIQICYYIKPLKSVNKWLKLIITDMKTNSSILMKLKIEGWYKAWRMH